MAPPRLRLVVSDGAPVKPAEQRRAADPVKALRADLEHLAWINSETGPMLAALQRHYADSEGLGTLAVACDVMARFVRATWTWGVWLWDCSLTDYTA